MNTTKPTCTIGDMEWYVDQHVELEICGLVWRTPLTRDLADAMASPSWNANHEELCAQFLALPEHSTASGSEIAEACIDELNKRRKSAAMLIRAAASEQNKWNDLVNEAETRAIGDYEPIRINHRNSDYHIYRHAMDAIKEYCRLLAYKDTTYAQVQAHHISKAAAE